MKKYVKPILIILLLAFVGCAVTIVSKSNDVEIGKGIEPELEIDLDLDLNLSKYLDLISKKDTIK